MEDLGSSPKPPSFLFPGIRRSANRATDFSQSRMPQKFTYFTQFVFVTISTCFSVWLRREFQGIDFLSPLDFALITLVLLALVFQYKWLSSRRGKMPFQLKLIVHIILYIFTIIVVSLVRNSVFHLIAVGAMATCMSMNPVGAGGDLGQGGPSTEGVQNEPTPVWGAEPGEEINSQPSQGVGQRLPGSLEPSSSSTGISASVESIFRELEQPRGEPAPTPQDRERPRVNIDLLDATRREMEIQERQRGVAANNASRAQAASESLESARGFEEFRAHEAQLLERIRALEEEGRTLAEQLRK